MSLCDKLKELCNNMEISERRLTLIVLVEADFYNNRKQTSKGKYIINSQDSKANIGENILRKYILL